MLALEVRGGSVERLAVEPLIDVCCANCGADAKPAVRPEVVGSTFDNDGLTSSSQDNINIPVLKL